MSKRNWKAVRPLNLKDALDWCVRYAKAQHNQSVEGIADIMGVNHWTLYKWIGEADMPARLIKAFEHACGIDYASRWLVESGGKMVVEIPRGKPCGPHDIQQLQAVYHVTVGELMGFYEDAQDIDSALSAIQTALEQTSWHKANVQKYRQPELPFDEEY
jgi:hypothetical protein